MPVDSQLRLSHAGEAPPCPHQVDSTLRIVLGPLVLSVCAYMRVHAPSKEARLSMSIDSSKMWAFDPAKQLVQRHLETFEESPSDSGASWAVSQRTR